jgi:hypothetical protein
LTLSLTTALLGILCKQWIQEYERDGSDSPRVALAVRELRYESLNYWKVPTILKSLPIFLQFAVIFFFMGVLDLLWSRHRKVAAWVTIFISFGILVLLSTTVAPAFHFARHHFNVSICAYKSPQSLAFFQLVVWLFGYNPKESNWLNYDIHRASILESTYMSSSLKNLDISPHTTDMVHHIYHCLMDRDHLSITTAISCLQEIYQARLGGHNLIHAALSEDLFAHLYLVLHKISDNLVVETGLRVIKAIPPQNLQPGDSARLNVVLSNCLNLMLYADSNSK